MIYDLIYFHSYHANLTFAGLERGCRGRDNSSIRTLPCNSPGWNTPNRSFVEGGRMMRRVECPERVWHPFGDGNENEDVLPNHPVCPSAIFDASWARNRWNLFKHAGGSDRKWFSPKWLKITLHFQQGWM
ncbi:hypothetical protein CDAR_366701 [Caerostris darwini]|uniref:Uncharacterized protein n=1 Tax=Caerostris darwini TaxID=1538125 RepID=A0AAV4Q8R0_9ARAC|nr:hypothetical protein CDAR_366701 [Caerostris darwini]